MADILVKCRKCGRENKVSEYAAAGAVACPSCGTPLEFESAAVKQARLQVRRIDGGRGETLTGSEVDRLKPTGETLTLPQSAPSMTEVYEDVHKVRQKTHVPYAIWNWIAFVAVAGILVGAQWYTTVVNLAWFNFYFWGRYAVWGVVLLLVLMVAFEDGTGQGLLCLFAPLYILYYALVRVEYYWLRGMFMAVIVGMGAELYYLEDKAALTVAQHHVNEFINGVGTQIERVGAESPEMTQPKSKRQRYKPEKKPQNAPLNKPRNIPLRRSRRY